MSKTKYFICFALACVAGISCRKEGPAGPESPREAIVFSANVAETKGAKPLNALVDLFEQDFSVSAWYTPDGDTFGANSVSYIQNHCFGTLEQREDGDYSASVWQGVTPGLSGKAADPAYYPLDGSLTFFSYAPYRSDVSGDSDVELIYSPASSITSRMPGYLVGSPLVNFTPSATPSTQIDFVAAAPVLDWRRMGGVVPLDFSEHLTTAVQFHARYSGNMNDDEGVVISRIIIRDVIGSEYLYFTQSGGSLGYAWSSDISPEDGSSSMPKASYVLEADKAELIQEDAYLVKDASKYLNQQINGRLYLLPQVLPDEAQLEITYVIRNKVSGVNLDENVLVYPLVGTADWPMGKTVKYDITIHVAERKDVSITTEIIDWEDAGNTHPDQELIY